MKAKFSNPKAQIYLLDEKFEKIKDNGTDYAYMKFDKTTKYVVIENKTDKTITGNFLLAEEAETITTDETKEVKLTKGDRFFKLTAQESGNHSIFIFIEKDEFEFLYIKKTA